MTCDTQTCCCENFTISNLGPHTTDDWSNRSINLAQPFNVFSKPQKTPKKDQNEGVISVISLFFIAVVETQPPVWTSVCVRSQKFCFLEFLFWMKLKRAKEKRGRRKYGKTECRRCFYLIVITLAFTHTIRNRLYTSLLYHQDLLENVLLPLSVFFFFNLFYVNIFSVGFFNTYPCFEYKRSTFRIKSLV